jgi:hypothetical protein
MPSNLALKTVQEVLKITQQIQQLYEVPKTPPQSKSSPSTTSSTFGKRVTKSRSGSIFGRKFKVAPGVGHNYASIVNAILKIIIKVQSYILLH